jgi:hypothetical protein
MNLTSKRTKASDVSRNWVKVKNPAAAKRGAEEDCGDNGAPSLATASYFCSPQGCELR